MLAPKQGKNTCGATDQETLQVKSREQDTFSKAAMTSL